MLDLNDVIFNLYNTNQPNSNIRELQDKIHSLKDKIPPEVLLAIHEIIFTIYQEL